MKSGPSSSDLAPPAEAYLPKGLYVAVLKPGFDFLAALVLLAILAPLFSVVSLAICLDSPGPPFFVQDRVGRLGRKFRIFKFRTMRNDLAGPELTQRNDPRVTRLGKLLRRTSIDELPQVLNILRGEMSFIGPRPEVPSVVVSQYSPKQKGVLMVRPGLSGWSQIHGRDDLSIPEKLAYDLEYVRRVSLGLDFLILVRTPWLLIKGSGIK